MTPDRAKELLDYDPRTGIFLWRVDRTGKALKGTEAGRLDGGGYRQISLDNKRYRANRLAWLIQYGEWPADEVDHINGVRTDDRIANLRAVTRSDNMKNKRRYKNTSGPHVGVKQRGEKWHAIIQNEHIGSFASAEDALAARMAAEHARGFHANHGRV